MRLCHISLALYVLNFAISASAKSLTLKLYFENIRAFCLVSFFLVVYNSKQNIAIIAFLLIHSLRSKSC